LCPKGLKNVHQRRGDISAWKIFEFGNTNIGVHGVEISGLEGTCGISRSGVRGAEELHLTEHLAPNKQILQRLLDAGMLDLPILRRQKFIKLTDLLMGVESNFAS
jgi:hypothetical protein